MGLFEREFIAAPDGVKGQIVYKHPDTEIRRFTRVTVNADQRALFVKQGVVMGDIGPGRHVLDADELPFLGAFIDSAIAKNVYKAELYFVASREFVNEPFGGRVDDVTDQQTGLLVSLHVEGEYSMRVTAPSLVVTRLAGTVDVTDNRVITAWVDQLLLKTMKVEISRAIVRGGWPVLGLSGYIPELEEVVLAATNTELSDYGLGLVRLGSFDVNLAASDLARLKELSKDHAYSELAGSYSAAAQAEMMKGIGKGAATFGPGSAGAFIASGIGIGASQQNFPTRTMSAGEAPPPAPADRAPRPTAACGTCHAPLAAEQRFCSQCGTAASIELACANCSATLGPAARFCSDCGTPR